MVPLLVDEDCYAVRNFPALKEGLNWRPPHGCWQWIVMIFYTFIGRRWAEKR